MLVLLTASKVRMELQFHPDLAAVYTVLRLLMMDRSVPNM